MVLLVRVMKDNWAQTGDGLWDRECCVRQGMVWKSSRCGIIF